MEKKEAEKTRETKKPSETMESIRFEEALETVETIEPREDPESMGRMGTRDPREPIHMNPLQRQLLDDVFDAFSMLARGAIVSVMHVPGGYTRYAPGAVELFGLPGEYIANDAHDWADYIHPEDRRRYQNVMQPLLEGKAQAYDLAYRVRKKNGEYGNFRAVGAVLRGADGRPSLIGDAMIDEGMTSKVDPITILPNKSAFMDGLSKKMRSGKAVFALLAGVGGLAEINRVHGYAYGNRILQETAWLLREVARDRCEVFRMDGAVFALLSDALTREEITAIYDMIRYRMQRGIEINGIRNTLRTNGGMISVYSEGSEPTAVLSCLQYAYAESKEHRHGDLVDFNGSIHYENAGSIELLSTIRDCIADGCRGFSLEYEPVIDAETGQINGCEATISWEDPVRGRVDPEDFMPILEHDFIFEELGEFMLRQGLSDGVRFLEKAPGFLLCLNAYRIQVDSDYFVEELFELLDETGFPPDQLSIKFDRDCQFVETGRAQEIVGRLHERGILSIIDGFGSGADTIGFLKTVPVDAVSTDSHFLRGIERSRRDRDILEHLARMAAACVRHINVKGVENEAQREILRAMPFTTMQGRLFTAPLPLEEILARYYA